MQIKTNILKSSLKNILLTVFGTVILAFGTAVFIIPYELVVGGMSGVAITVNHVLPSLSIDLIITVLTWGLFLLGLIILGKDFALKTLISAIVYPPAISVFQKFASEDFLDGIFYLKNTEYSEMGILIAAIFGGLLIGVGCAVTFLGGGSTGGTDIVAFAITKFFKRLNSSHIIFITDSTIIILGLLAIKDLTVSLLGIISVFVSMIIIDKIFVGGSKALIAQIVSDRCEEISQEIIKRLERTTTLVDVTGGYTHEKKQMIMVSFTMRQYAELSKIINEVDCTAFVTVHQAHEINGEGWTR